MTYINEIISRASDNAVTSISDALYSIGGHIPKASRQIVSNEDGIISPVSGSAIRFVMMK